MDEVGQCNISMLVFVMQLSQQIVKEATFQEVALSIDHSYCLSLLKITGKTEEPLSIQILISAGSCYDCTSAQLLLQQNQKAPSLVQFPNSLSILLDNRETIAHFSLSFFFKQSRISTSCMPINLNQHLNEEKFELQIVDANSESIGRVKLGWFLKPKEVLPTITIKNINYQLKNSILAPPRSLYLDLALGSRKYKNKGVNKVDWNAPFRLFIEQERTIVWGLADDSGLRIPIPPQKVENFNLRKGFKRIFISDELEMPKGCIQFYYEGKGLRSEEDYERQAELEENIQRQILKFTVKTIKGKLKEPHNKVSVRAFLGMNFLKTEQITEESTQLLFTLNQYLYLEPKENRCNFLVYSGEDVLGWGNLQLSMIGFFERRVGIFSAKTKKEIGYLMVSVHSEKHPGNTVQLAKLKLNFGSFPLQVAPYFLSFFIRGTYTRTQLQKPDGNTMSFRRYILMKYTKEEQIQVALMDMNNQEILKTVVNIELLKQSSNSAFSRKTLSILPEFNCTLQCTSINGDLNKLNIHETTIKNETLIESIKIQPQTNDRNEDKNLSNSLKKPPNISLLELKNSKQAQIKLQKKNLEKELQEFEASLVNHINNKTDKSRPKRKGSEENRNKFDSGHFRIMFSSRPLKNSSQYLSSEKVESGTKQGGHIELPLIKTKGKQTESYNSRLAPLKKQRLKDLM